MRRVLKCVFAYDKFDHHEVALCDWQDIKIQLVVVVVVVISIDGTVMQDKHCFLHNQCLLWQVSMDDKVSR